MGYNAVQEKRLRKPSEGAPSDGGSCGAAVRCPPAISRLRVEKIEGGLMVAGVVVAANCQVALPAFGFLFILVGIVLTAASYRGPGQDEEPDHYADRVAFTGNSRVLGPACIVVGAVMLAAGAGLWLLTRRARRRERRVGFHCPLHGDFYPLSPAPSARSQGSKQPAPWSLFWRGAARGAGFTAPPQCPHSSVSSTRSSVSSAAASPCPTPLPFLVTSGSVSSGMVLAAGTNISPDQTFGSIRSLSVSREVASFPLSRTPTPPSLSPQSLHRTLSPPLAAMEEGFAPPPGITVVAPATTGPEAGESRPSARGGPRKSVSIVLPEEGKG
ncbi:uncharacterized protein LOC134535237 isoform X2 [Bacillus rossius redtenbacheri]|uniref:uncharacterized protein LOC134535237 isoform X2 n=1 Tax=Bacillus rossius redtenbacheri TaxID=93214 RepID=UPI002FDCFFC0